MPSRRRELLLATAALGLGGVGGVAASLLAAPPHLFRRTPEEAPAAPAGVPQAKKQQDEEPNSPPETLMLDHAVEERLLLIYAEIADRLAAQVDRAVIGLLRQSALVVRKFAEDYHQKFEEQQIFPSLSGRAELGPLLTTLRAQHTAGRMVTDKILAATAGLPAAGRDLAAACRAFIRLRRPHMAREATQVFQVLYDCLAEKKIDEISEALETKQEELLGPSGLEKLLAQIAAVEKELGLDDLHKFTPQS
jgi:hemerythrin-like domain-containing protein